MLCKDTLILLTALQYLWAQVSFQNLFSKNCNGILGHLWSHGLQIGHFWCICWNMEIKSHLDCKSHQLLVHSSVLQCSELSELLKILYKLFFIILFCKQFCLDCIILVFLYRNHTWDEISFFFHFKTNFLLCEKGVWLALLANGEGCRIWMTYIWILYWFCLG